jgi:hypothetical protein
VLEDSLHERRARRQVNRRYGQCAGVGHRDDVAAAPPGADSVVNYLGFSVALRI